VFRKGRVTLCFIKGVDVMIVEFVTVRLSLNFIVGCWDYTVEREDRVS
jgi:hypothetical protein